MFIYGSNDWGAPSLYNKGAYYGRNEGDKVRGPGWGGMTRYEYQTKPL
jgi:hypothetical protein